MKKLLLIIITLATFTNLSYASFPIDTNKADTTQVVLEETTEQYHLRMEKQGFDIESCVCESCRSGIAIKNIKNVNNRTSNDLYKSAVVLFALALIVFVVWILDGFHCINDSATCSTNNTSLIAYVTLLMIFGYSSVFYFFKAFSIQNKNKLK